MSFSELQHSNSIRKKKEFEIKVKLSDGTDKILTFTASQISYLQAMEVESLKVIGKDWVSKFVACSVTDAHGNKMSLSQAEQLSDEHAAIFLNNVLEVNPLAQAQNQEVSEDKKK